MRFFCAGTTTPETFGLLSKKPEDSARRMLVLISKVVSLNIKIQKLLFKDLLIFFPKTKLLSYKILPMVFNFLVPKKNI